MTRVLVIDSTGLLEARQGSITRAEWLGRTYKRRPIKAATAFVERMAGRLLAAGVHKRQIPPVALPAENGRINPYEGRDKERALWLFVDPEPLSQLRPDKPQQFHEDGPGGAGTGATEQPAVSVKEEHLMVKDPQMYRVIGSVALADVGYVTYCEHCKNPAY
jgi:hypothetical protein